MKIKERLINYFNVCDSKFEQQFECKIRDVTFEKIAAYMFKPKDSSSLAVTRIFFGLAMLFDLPDERGGATMDRRWGDPKTCHFPLLPFLPPLGMPYMALVYAALWLGALGIMLGYKYRLASATFTICYWYLFLAEKSFWNNHSYLFGLVALLLACTEANCYWSLDAYLDPSKKQSHVPYWNYFVLKYQFFILYFMAGLKKGTAEWLSGYSVQRLSEHWVFTPFKLFLTVPQTDYLVVHWFIFGFDLTVAGWMMWARSRNLAMLLCALFHLMNSRLFRIGMFPWVCLATMPLFYSFDWPKMMILSYKEKISAIKHKIMKHIPTYLKLRYGECKQNNQVQNETEKWANNETPKLEFMHEEKHEDIYIPDANADTENDGCLQENNESEDGMSKDDPKFRTNEIENKKTTANNKGILFFIIFFVISQAFLPYSHFITKGYNNWTNGLYGYSWDMMVHTWEPHAVVVKVVDNEKNSEFYVDPYLFTPNDRWTRHGDMVYQYAQCLKKKILASYELKELHAPKSISIYVDVWYSLNGRFVQRMFDPKVDLLKASWSPLRPTHYLMPILDEALHWRQTLEELRAEVNSWGEQNDVTFFAEFPGYEQEKFIPTEMRNVSLVVLEGVLAFESEVTSLYNGQSYKLAAGNRVMVDSGMFHRVLNIGDSAAFYMYTYYNSSEAEVARMSEETKPKLPIASELMRRLANMVKFGGLVLKGLVQSIFKLTQCQ